MYVRLRATHAFYGFIEKNRAARELGRPSCSSRIMVDLARLAQLKRLLNDGTLTREEFEALKQKEL